MRNRHPLHLQTYNSEAMTEEEARAIFILAGIGVSKLHRLENKYWPEHPDYDDVRRKSPWWLVVTPFGTIELGWRKRVISINWSGTEARKIITADDLTKGETYVHAYCYAKAVEYMAALARELSLSKPITPKE